MQNPFHSYPLKKHLQGLLKALPHNSEYRDLHSYLKFIILSLQDLKTSISQLLFVRHNKLLMFAISECKRTLIFTGYVRINNIQKLERKNYLEQVLSEALTKLCFLHFDKQD